MRIPGPLRQLAVTWTFLFWIFCIAVPVLTLLARALGSSQAASGLFDPQILWVVRATLWQALISTLLAGLIGTALGVWAGASRMRWAQVILAVPYGIPTVVVASVAILWLGRSGLDIAYSLKSVIIAHVFLNAPWVALRISQARARVPEEQLEAARSLGAGRGSQFRWAIWPYLRWTLGGALVQVFSLCAMSFAIVLLLGGGPPVETLETAIYARMRFGNLDISSAAACALWQLLITLAPWALLLFFEARSLKLEVEDADTLELDKRVLSKNCSKYDNFALFSVCALFLLPYLALFRIATWLPFLSCELLSELRRPLIVSLELALMTASACVVTAIAAVTASKKWPGPSFGLLMGIPAGISVLVLGLGFWLAYGKWLDPFEGSLIAMAALQTTLFFPLTYRTLWPVAAASQTSLLEAACTLGASPLKAFWHIEWPRWRSPLISAFAIVAGTSLGEVAAVSLFYSENLIPLPLLVTRWMGQYRFAEAQAVAFLLFLLSAGTSALFSALGVLKKWDR